MVSCILKLDYTGYKQTMQKCHPHVNLVIKEWPLTKIVFVYQQTYFTSTSPKSLTNYIYNEPPHKKTNNLHNIMRKQRRRSASR